MDFNLDIELSVGKAVDGFKLIATGADPKKACKICLAAKGKPASHLCHLTKCTAEHRSASKTQVIWVRDRSWNLGLI